MEEEKLPQQLVISAGVFYVCYRLSQMGWNVIRAVPKMRKAKEPNVVIESADTERTWRIKVRSLSKPNKAVSLHEDPNIDVDWVVVCIEVRTNSPRCFVMTPDEVSKLASRDRDGKDYWLEPAQYDTAEFTEQWGRMGSGLAVR